MSEKPKKIKCKKNRKAKNGVKSRYPYIKIFASGLVLTLVFTLLIFLAENLIAYAIHNGVMDFDKFASIVCDVEKASKFTKTALLTLYVWYVIEMFVNRSYESLHKVRLSVLIVSVVWYLAEEAIVRTIWSIIIDAVFILLLISFSFLCLLWQGRKTTKKAKSGHDDGSATALI
jgi:hypothetical protein